MASRQIIGEDKMVEFHRMLAKVMIRVFGHVYLRSPNEEDTQRLMATRREGGRAC
jgi:hypothetical protein